MRRHRLCPVRPVAHGAALAALLLTVGCGYHLAGKNAVLPEHIRRIAVPTFENQTRQPEIAQRITERVVDEFVARGNYVMTSSAEGADAVLVGLVSSYRKTPVAIDEGGRTTRFEIIVELQAELRDRVNDAILWKNDHFVFRGQYSVPEEQSEFFEQSIIAIDQVSRDSARSIVASILEGF